MAQTSSIVVHLEAAIEARLADLAQHRGQPVSELAAQAIASFVELEAWQEQHIRQGLAELDAGQGISNDRVTEWLDSWGTDHEPPSPR
jgi:predicted transcriptional regulator